MGFKESMLALHQTEQKKHEEYQASEAGKFAVRVRKQMRKMCESKGWTISFAVTPIDHRTAHLQFVDGTELRAIGAWDKKVSFQARVHCPDCGSPGWSYERNSLSEIAEDLVRGELSHCPCSKRWGSDPSTAVRLVDALIAALSDEFDQWQG